MQYWDVKSLGASLVSASLLAILSLELLHRKDIVDAAREAVRGDWASKIDDTFLAYF